MKTKKMIIALFLATATVSAFAQSNSKTDNPKFELGIFGGLNTPRLSGGGGNPLSDGWSSRSGEAYGLTLNWNISSHFGWRADVLYSSEGGQRNGMQALDGSSFNPQIPAGTYLYANYNNESILNYLEVPVMAKYTLPVSKSTRFYVDFGPYLGFLLNAKQKTSGSSIVYADAAGTQPVSVNPQTGQVFAAPFDADTNISSDIHSVNLGLTGGIGYMQGVGFGDIFVDFRGGYGLTTIQRDTKNGISHTGNFLIALGYSIPL
jgi:hypothetical protein